MRDIDNGTIDPTKSNMMLECNRAREEFGSSMILKGIDNVEAIHVHEVHKDTHN